MEKKEPNFKIGEWRPIIELSLVLVTILGSTIPLYVHMDNRSHEQITAIHQTLEGIRQDMRDFHGRLERQDAEFKAHLHYHSAYEERNRGK